MSEDIVKHSVDSIKERIVNKIRADFVELVPDDHWDQLVQGELDNFLKVPSYPSGAVAPLNGMIRDAFKEIFLEKIKQELSKPEWTGLFMPNGIEASEMITKLIRENADVLVASMTGNFVQGIVERIKNENFNSQF